MGRKQANEAERKRKIRDEKEAQEKKDKAAHRTSFFIDDPDTLVAPEGIVFANMEVPE